MKRNLGDPDERAGFPGVIEEIVDLGDLTVGRITTDPGWRWSTHVKPHVGGEWCQARHIGVMLSGSIGVALADGTTYEVRPMDVYEIPPGHDGWTVGGEPAVMIEWFGVRTFLGPHAGLRGRGLVTLLFTDIVDSTKRAIELGDVSWRDVLAEHYEAARAALERFGGREVKTTGDGMLAVFDSPAAAIRCGAAIARGSEGHGLQVRVGVHVGEAELVGPDVRGVAVHHAARVMAAAAPGEVVVSDVARAIVASAGLPFEDRGMHDLKGIPGEHRLAVYTGD